MKVINIYRERQKLNERKVSRCTESHLNAEKSFAVFASFVLKMLPLLKAHIRKTFTIY